MNKLILSAMITIAFLPIITFSQSVKPNNENSDRVDALVAEQMNQLHIPGLSLAIIRDGKIIKMQGYGLANVETNAKATPDTVYEIGSVTKQFTSTAVMMLIEEKKIELDAPISKYLSDIPEAWKSVTVHQLLNQISGIKDYFTDDKTEFLQAAHFSAKREQILAAALNTSLNYTPGAAYNYSNTNHFLLGLLIEKTSGKTYADFMQEQIFMPLGMTATQISDHQNIIKNRAVGYNYDWGKNILLNTNYVDASWSFAAGSIISTVNDLAKWDNALDGEKLVGKESKKLMWTAGRLKSGVPVRYGFGWYVDRVNGHTNLSHGGDITGFATYFSRYPNDRLTVILSMNQYIYPKRISDKIAEIYLPALTYQPIADKDANFTVLVKNLYANLAEGKTDLWESKLFTSDEWKSIQANFSVAGNLEFYNRLGAAKSATLVERSEDENGLLTRYRVAYANNARLVKFVRNEKGFITEWADYEE